jgi:Nucleotidyltransferase domain
MLLVIAFTRSLNMGGFDVIDRRFEVLYERALRVLGADYRVASVGLSGSVLRGTADKWSDLDLEVVAHAEHHASFLADWPQWLAMITPTVFARTPIAPFIINTVTDEGLTLDIAVWSGNAIEFPVPSQYTVGQLSGARFDDVGTALEYAVVEQLRGLTGPFVSLIQREEHVRHLTGVPHLIGLLTTVFLAETELPQPGKHWNSTFTQEQRDAIAALPPVRATREDIIAFGLGVARLIVDRARPLYPHFGLEWPHALATVTSARLRSELGIETEHWLY